MGFTRPAWPADPLPGTSPRFAIFMAHLIEKGVLDADPTAHLAAPRQWQSLPKYLNKQQIDDLMASCDSSKPQGLRDRAMLEFLYATGLRVSELCGVRVSELERNMGVVRVVGKGNKHRIVPVGQVGTVGGRTVSGRRPAGFAEGPCQPIPVRYQSRRRDVAPGFLAVAGGLRKEGGNLPRFDAPRPASYICHAPAGRRSGSEKPAEHAGALRYLDHPDLYPCSAFPVAEDRGRASSESLNRFESQSVLAAVAIPRAVQAGSQRMSAGARSLRRGKR